MQTPRRSKNLYLTFETEDLLAVGIFGTWIATVSCALALRLLEVCWRHIRDRHVGCAVCSWFCFSFAAGLTEVEIISVRRIQGQGVAEKVDHKSTAG